MKKALRASCLVMALTLAASSMSAARAAHGMVSGAVVAGSETAIRAEAGGRLEEMNLIAGMLVEKGDLVARVTSQKVFAPIDGTVSGLCVSEGSDASGVDGAALYLEPIAKYTLSASTSYAYQKVLGNAFVHVGETLTLMCIIDGTHRGSGVITAVEGENFTIQTTRGEFYVGEAVNAYRGDECIASARVGRATVYLSDNETVAGEGTVTKVYVKNGDRVEKGELLFETVLDAGDSRASGAETRAKTGGVVTGVSVQLGDTVTAGDVLATVAQISSRLVLCRIPESVCASLSEGDAAQVSFTGDPWGARYDAVIQKLSRAAEEAEEDDESALFRVYLRVIDLPDAIRLGMTATVYF